jgi:maltooligosyltrehalose trehalohydrolase
VSFLQNHDQIGNRAFGERILALADGEAVRAAMAILLLAPSPPLLFMGEEFAAATPFLFFSDFEGELAASVQGGPARRILGIREIQLARDPRQNSRPERRGNISRSKLDWESLELGSHRDWLEFYRICSACGGSTSPGSKADRSATEFRCTPPRGPAGGMEIWPGSTITLLANLGSAVPTCSARRPGALDLRERRRM